MSNNSTTVFETIEKKQEAQNTGIAALVLGICGLLFPGLGLILGIIGVVCAKKARNISGGTLNGMAQAGMICSIISIVLGAIIALLIIGYFVIMFVYVFLMAGVFAAITG